MRTPNWISQIQNDKVFAWQCVRMPVSAKHAAFKLSFLGDRVRVRVHEGASEQQKKSTWQNSYSIVCLYTAAAPNVHARPALQLMHSNVSGTSLWPPNHLLLHTCQRRTYSSSRFSFCFYFWYCVCAPRDRPFSSTCTRFAKYTFEFSSGPGCSFRLVCSLHARLLVFGFTLPTTTHGFRFACERKSASEPLP